MRNKKRRKILLLSTHHKSQLYTKLRKEKQSISAEVSLQFLTQKLLQLNTMHVGHYVKLINTFKIKHILVAKTVSFELTKRVFNRSKIHIVEDWTNKQQNLKLSPKPSASLLYEPQHIR